MVTIPEATKKGYAIARDGDGIDLSYLSSKSRRGRVAKQSMHTITCNSDSNGVVVDSKPKVIGQVSSPESQSGKVYSEDGLFPTLCAGTHGYAMGNVEHSLRIRKLTPLECWRLMGFDDEEFYKAAKVNSNSQLYKQAGNSIVVDVLYDIVREFFI